MINNLYCNKVSAHASSCFVETIAEVAVRINGVVETIHAHIFRVVSMNLND